MQEVFEKIKERLEEKAELNEQMGYLTAYDVTREYIEIVNQVAEEYGKSEQVNKHLDSLHEKILKSKFAEEVTELEIDALVKAKQGLANNNQSLTNGGWIPCSKELPSDGEIHECTVLFNTGMRYIEYAYYDMAREEWWTHDDTGLVNVIAWKSSPEPYRGE